MFFYVLVLLPLGLSVLANAFGYPMLSMPVDQGPFFLWLATFAMPVYVLLCVWKVRADRPHRKARADDAEAADTQMLVAKSGSYAVLVRSSAPVQHSRAAWLSYYAMMFSVMAMFWLGGCGMLAAIVNRTWDTSEARTIETPVWKMTRGKGFSYDILVTDWDRPERRIWLPVSRSGYAAVAQGMNARLSVKQGYLGFRWKTTQPELVLPPDAQRQLREPPRRLQ